MKKSLVIVILACLFDIVAQATSPTFSTIKVTSTADFTGAAVIGFRATSGTTGYALLSASSVAVDWSGVNNAPAFITSSGSNAYSNTSGSSTVSGATNDPRLATAVQSSQANQPNGYLGLDGSGNAVGTFIARTGTRGAIDAIVLAAGELATVSDFPQTRLGDGVTAGGVMLSPPITSQAVWYVGAKGTPAQNFQEFSNAYVAAAASTPYGAALSASNRAVVILAPGRYDMPSTTGLSAPFVDVIGAGRTPGDVVFTGTAVSASSILLTQIADNINFANFTVISTATTSINYGGFRAGSFGYANSTYTDLVLIGSGSNGLGGMVGSNIRGVWTRCATGDGGFGYTAGSYTVSGTFIDCVAGNNSFGKTFSGYADRCISTGTGSFGPTTMSGTAVRCSAVAFGNAAGNYYDCYQNGIRFGAVLLATGTTASAAPGSMVWSGAGGNLIYDGTNWNQEVMTTATATLGSGLTGGTIYGTGTISATGGGGIPTLNGSGTGATLTSSTLAGPTTVSGLLSGGTLGTIATGTSRIYTTSTTATAIPVVAGDELFVYKSGSSTVSNSTTLADDPDLQITLTGTHIYYVTFAIGVTESTGSSGYKTGFAFTGTATDSQIEIIAGQGYMSVSYILGRPDIYNNLANLFPLGPLDNGTSGNGMYYTGHFFMKVTATGVLKFQFANHTATSAPTVSRQFNWMRAKLLQ